MQLKREYTEMLKQDLGAEEDEDHAAGKFCFGFIFRAEYCTGFYTERRKQKCDHADRKNCGYNADIGEKRKGDADRKRIDACCDCHSQHGTEA